MVVSVYLGSSGSCAGKYKSLAYELGKLIALKGHTLCYGGATAGTMGDLADGAQENGGKVIGVYPEGFLGTKEMREKGVEVRHNHLDKMYEVADFAQRKQLMEELCDCAVVLPGGIGTMDELFTFACDYVIEKHSKVIHILNYEGYYDHLREFLLTMDKEKFLKGNLMQAVIFDNSLEELSKFF